MTSQSRDLPGIGERLKKAREAAGLTQQQTAKMLGISRPAISEMESETRTVSIGELKKLAEFYKVSLQWLAGEPIQSDEKVRIAARRLSALREEDIDTIMRIVDSFRREHPRRTKAPK